MSIGNVCPKCASPIALGADNCQRCGVHLAWPGIYDATSTPPVRLANPTIPTETQRLAPLWAETPAENPPMLTKAPCPGCLTALEVFTTPCPHCHQHLGWLQSVPYTVTPPTDAAQIRAGNEQRRQQAIAEGKAGYVHFPEGPISERRYLPTLPELIDRLSIVLQKRIFIPGNEEAYRTEIDDIKDDITLLMDGVSLGGEAIYALLVLMLSNRVIWENEGAVRRGENMDDAEVGRRLKATHSINGVRNTAKNVLSDNIGGRKDYKIDALAADLPAEFGNWNVFS